MVYEGSNGPLIVEFKRSSVKDKDESLFISFSVNLKWQKYIYILFEFAGLYKKKRDDYNSQEAKGIAESYPGSPVWLSSKLLLERAVCLHNVTINVSDLRVTAKGKFIYYSSNKYKSYWF